MMGWVWVMGLVLLDVICFVSFLIDPFKTKAFLADDKWLNANTAE